MVLRVAAAIKFFRSSSTDYDKDSGTAIVSTVLLLLLLLLMAALLLLFFPPAQLTATPTNATIYHHY